MKTFKQFLESTDDSDEFEMHLDAVIKLGISRAAAKELASWIKNYHPEPGDMEHWDEIYSAVPGWEQQITALSKYEFQDWVLDYVTHIL